MYLLAPKIGCQYLTDGVNCQTVSVSTHFHLKHCLSTWHNALITRWQWHVHSFTYIRTVSPMACVPKMARGKISLARGSPQIFYFSFPPNVSKLWRTCVYMHTSDTVQTLYELPLISNNTAVKHFYTNRSGAKCWLDIYRRGAGLAVTGPIRDIGQNVL